MSITIDTKDLTELEQMLVLVAADRMVALMSQAKRTEHDFIASPIGVNQNSHVDFKWDRKTGERLEGVEFLVRIALTYPEKK